MLLQLAVGLLFVQFVPSYCFPDGVKSSEPEAVDDRFLIDTIMDIGRTLVGPEEIARAGAFGEGARERLSKAGQIVGKTAEGVAGSLGLKNLGAVASSVSEKLGNASGHVVEGGSKLVGALLG